MMADPGGCHQLPGKYRPRVTSRFNAMSGQVPPNRRPLFALYVAGAVSLTGNSMALVAIPWFVLVTTGSPSQTGLVAFFTVLPAVLAGFLGGVLVDRMGFRTMSVISDVASGITMGLIPLLHYAVGLQLWQLIALVFFGTLLDSPGTTARSSLLPDLAEVASMELERATSLHSGIQRGSTMAGAPLAGLIIALFNAPTVLWINAATFGISALLVAVMVPRPEPTHGTPASYFSDLTSGLRYLLGDRLVRTIVIIVMVTNFLDGPVFAVYLPVYAQEILHSPVALGLTVGTFGAFALLGALVFAAVGSRLPRRMAFIGAFIAVGVPFLVLATLPPLWVAIAAMAVAGLAAGPINPLISTVAYERIPADLRGRVLGAMTAGVFVALPVGMLLGGYLVEWIGLGNTLLAVGASYVLLTVSLLTNRSLKAMNTGRSPHSSNSGPSKPATS